MPSDSQPGKTPGEALSTTSLPSRWSWLTTLLVPFGVRNFRFLFVGQVTSTLGDTFYAVALPWLFLSTGHTPQELGIVLAAYGVPRVGTILLGGWLSDRIRPRRVMLISDSMRALCVGLMVIFIALGYVDVWRLGALSSVLGVFTGLFLPAYYAVMPELLSDEALQAGNALNTSGIQSALFLGSALAGLVVSHLRPEIAFLVDACSFVISAGTLVLMGRDRVNPAVEEKQGAAESTGEREEQSVGTRFASDITFWQLFRTWRLLQVALLVIVFGNFLFSGMFEVALPTLAHDQFAAGAGGYGLLLAAFGAGSLLGGLGAGILGRFAHQGIFLLVLITVLGMCYTLVPFVGGLNGALVLIGCAGLTNGLLTVLAFTILQRQAPRHLLGGLMAVLLFASLGLYPFSVALAGVLAVHFGPVLLFPLSGAMMLCAAIFGYTQREVRTL